MLAEGRGHASDLDTRNIHDNSKSNSVSQYDIVLCVDYRHIVGVSEDFFPGKLKDYTAALAI